MPAALVFAGVPVQPTPRLRARLAALRDPFVVAGDSGAEVALSFGLIPNVLVGDMDSIDASVLADLERRGLKLERHPRDKDATDGQLALERALALDPEQLVLVGYLGGARLDQAIANVLLLARAPVQAILLDAHNEATLLRDGERHAWMAEPDEVVSLLPLAGDAHGVRTEGLRFPLEGERLVFGDTRGISNEPAASQVAVAIARGLLLVARHFPAG